VFCGVPTFGFCKLNVFNLKFADINFEAEEVQIVTVELVLTGIY
jgi:hypothetical protein